MLILRYTSINFGSSAFCARMNDLYVGSQKAVQRGIPSKRDSFKLMQTSFILWPKEELHKHLLPQYCWGGGVKEMGKKETDMLCSCFMWSHVVPVTQDRDMCTLDIIHVWIRMFLSCCSSTQHHKNSYTVTLDKGTPKDMQKKPQILSEIPTIFSGFPPFDMIYWVGNPQCISFLCPSLVFPWAHVRFYIYIILWGDIS